MLSNENPRFLVLKQEYREKFSNEAKKKFPEGHNAGLGADIQTYLGVSINRQTIARILAGKRGEFGNVEAICRYFINSIDSDDWMDACEPNDQVRSLEENLVPKNFDLDELINGIKSKIRFSFENLSQSTGASPTLWVKEHFVELDMVEVSQVPSEYPALDRKVLTGSKDSIEDEFDRIGIKLLRGCKTTGSEVLSKYMRIFVYGDPGSGKSSYLQSIALKCREGQICSQFIPIFIEIRRYSAADRVATITAFIEKIFEDLDISSQHREYLLNAGRVFFLFDGLDEAFEGKRSKIEFMLQEVMANYPTCKYIFSSRLASVFSLPAVQKVVISPFYSNKQIPKFVNRWFEYYGSNSSSAESMLEKLRSPKYAGIREIARRPVLLNLLCLTYDSNGDFPTQRAGVFASGISALTRKSQHLNTEFEDAPFFKEQDIKNILARVASYFFVQLGEQILFTVRDVERIIKDYCQEVHQVNPETVDGNTILQAIEQFNGLLVRWGESYCSFSHLTYQEYFTAEHLISTNTYTEVYKYLADERWNFVIELVSELVPRNRAWEFFIGFKVTTDNFVNSDTRLVDFLRTVDQASTFVSYTIGAQKKHIQSLVRAWYFVYSIENISSINNIKTFSQKFDLPDFHFATSMVNNRILQGHEILYKAYHFCDEEDKASRFISLIREIRRFFDGDSRRRDIIDGWLHKIQEQLVKFDAQEDWWEAKRYRWKESIAHLFNNLGLPSTYELSREQIMRLVTYYRITRLFSTCINRSNLTDDRFSEMADSMLRITNLIPDRDDFMDSV